MKVLLISNQHPNAEGVGNPIMYRMRNALEQDNRIDEVVFEPAYYSIGSLLTLRKKAKNFDVVHIHFGGMYALLIRIFLIGLYVKKFITFHGTDIHAKALGTARTIKEKLKIKLNQIASFVSIWCFDRCGFVAKEMMDYVPACFDNQIKNKAFLQPLGVDYTIFVPMSKELAQHHLSLPNGKYVLFSDVSNTSIKRRDLAEAIVKELGQGYQLLIMSGVKPSDVPYYINACDFALLTSDEEGSPNIIREVLSLNKPFFSVEVGDAAKQLSGLNNSAIISRDPRVASEKINELIALDYIDNTRESKKDKLDFVMINKEIISLYFE